MKMRSALAFHSGCEYLQDINQKNNKNEDIIIDEGRSGGEGGGGEGGEREGAYSKWMVIVQVSEEGSVSLFEWLLLQSFRRYIKDHRPKEILVYLLVYLFYFSLFYFICFILFNLFIICLLFLVFKWTNLRRV